MSLAMKVSRAQYQGDPGLWGFIKGAAKGAVALATGGPLAAAQSIAQSIRGDVPIQPAAPLPPMVIGATTPAPATPLAVSLTRPGVNGLNGQVPAPGALAAVERFLPGGQTGMMPAPNGCPANGRGGYHLNKSSYFLRSGQFVPAGSRWVRNRRRNPGNIRAASRALSRVTATKKALQTFSKVSIRDDSAPKTKTVYRCLKCKKNPCTC